MYLSSVEMRLESVRASDWEIENSSERAVKRGHGTILPARVSGTPQLLLIGKLGHDASLYLPERSSKTKSGGKLSSETMLRQKCEKRSTLDFA